MKKYAIQCLVLVTVSILSIQPYAHAATLLSDDFAGTFLNTSQWTEVDFNVVGGVVSNNADMTITVGGGTMSINGTGPTNGIDKGRGILSNSSFSFPAPGSTYTLTVDLTASTSTGFSFGKQASVGIGFYANNNNYLTMTLFHGYFNSNNFELEAQRRVGGHSNFIGNGTVQSVPGVLTLTLESSGKVSGSYGGTSISMGTINPAAFSSFQIILPATARTFRESVFGDYDRVQLMAEYPNRAPVAMNDPQSGNYYYTVENAPAGALDIAAPGVLGNDTDADDDTLTVVLDTDVGNGTLVLSSDGSFTYTPDVDFCGYEHFTYYANDGHLDSNIATANIYVRCAPDITSVDPNTQTADYSDAIATVTIIAEDSDTPVGGPDLEFGVNGLPNSVNVSSSSCVTAFASLGQRCTWTLDGIVDVPAGVFEVTFTVSDGDGGVTTCSDETSCVHTLTVESEDAIVTLDDTNPIDLNDLEGEADLFSLFFKAVEQGHPADLVEPLDNAYHDPNSGESHPGDLNHMVPQMVLTPVGPGGPVNPTDCYWDDDITTSPGDLDNPKPSSGDGYAQIAYFQCIYENVPVNTYEVMASVDGDYYAGDSVDGVLVVYDPSLGFTTGGGFFYWPDTEVPLDACLEYECAEFDTTECLVFSDVCLVPDPCAGYIGDKTNFGFNFKYNKKQRNIQGNLLMMRHTIDENCVDLNWKVKSNNIDGMGLGSETDSGGNFGWAAVSGKVSFRDAAEYNTGGNAFLFYVEDHGEQGCNQVLSDEFWIDVAAPNIWEDPLGPDAAADDPVDPEDGDALPIFCGNIVIPQETGDRGRKLKPDK